MSPGVENLFRLLKAAGQVEMHTALMNDYNAGSLQYVTLKDAVADALVSLSDSIREKKKEVMADKKTYKDRVKASAAEIRKSAQQTLQEVKELTGLMHTVN
jgi:tryptophanyl-tRNA synthetase